ncbi:hypothetical protein [Chryseobacterium sp. HSC-36S06]|uniref:hypothetical protein n=1 Tax=Chryseobacterium sp. HSC-36S06 TaxID=2910970 RepID=UPI00209E50AD|nr:hypothetical protein [Chryseobacterium sp. HSC-36S06]MCP2038273.1 hypothetical protein [Chryseobacterium sp. HSC-36S06]
MKNILPFFIATVFALTSCEPVYKAANFQQTANTHRLIAVLPPKVIMEIKSAKEAAAIKKQEVIESEKFQSALVNYLNEHQSNNKIFIKAQHPEETNKILKDNNVTSLAGKSYQNLAVLLGVDAVVSSRVSLAKPLTNGEAFFTSLLTGYSTPSKITTVDLSLTDKTSGKMFWNYNWQTGGTFVSAEKLTNSLMKAAAIRFPYKTKDLE